MAKNAIKKGKKKMKINDKGTCVAYNWNLGGFEIHAITNQNLSINLLTMRCLIPLNPISFFFLVGTKGGISPLDYHWTTIQQLHN